MGYHKREIKKGEYGDVSKIFEEFEEFVDSIDQNASIMSLIELSDLIGSIEGYLEQKYKGSITLDDLIKMRDITKSAFEDGERK